MQHAKFCSLRDLILMRRVVGRSVSCPMKEIAYALSHFLWKIDLVLRLNAKGLAHCQFFQCFPLKLCD